MSPSSSPPGSLDGDAVTDHAECGGSSVTRGPYLVVLRATDDELDAVVERIGEVICVPHDHDGRCRTPWTLIRSVVDDLDEPDRSAKRSLLDDA